MARAGGSQGRGRAPLADAILSIATGLAVLALYLPTVATGILEGDPGEFQLAAAIGGLAHPTGYPLYLSLGWLWAQVAPVTSTAHALNLLSALFGAGAVGLTCRLVLEVDRDAPWWAAWPAGAAAGLALAASPAVWSQSIVAEVYTFHGLLLAALALAVLRLARRPDRWWVIGLVLGLGLAHHRMMMLYVPPVLAALLLARPSRPRRVDLLRTALIAALPLLLYAYLPLRAPHTPYLQLELAPGDKLILYRNDLQGFLSFVSGQPFGSAITVEGLSQRLVAAVGWAVAEVGPLVWALATAGAVWLCRSRRPMGALLVGSLGLNVAFNLVYSIGDIHVFYLPVYQMAAALAGTSMIAVAGRRAVLAPLLAAAVAVVSMVGLPEAQAHALASVPRPPTDRWPALLEQAPSDAILLSNDRNEIVPLWYHQYALGIRPDVLGLFPLIAPEPAYAHIGALVHRSLETGRGTYLIKDMPGLEVGFRLEPTAGALIRVAGTWEADRVGTFGVLSEDLELLDCTVHPAEAAPGESVTVVLFWRPLERLDHPYSTYVHVLDAEGQPAWPGSDHRPGGVFYPADLWAPGTEIRDEHLLTVPEDAEPGTYHLLGGMYQYPSLEGYGGPLDLGTISVK